MQQPNSITLQLSHDEALVLFESIACTTARNIFDIEDGASHRALWNLGAALEAELPESLCENYLERLTRARTHLHDQTN